MQLLTFPVSARAHHGVVIVVIRCEPRCGELLLVWVGANKRGASRVIFNMIVSKRTCFVIGLTWSKVGNMPEENTYGLQR